MRTLQRAFFIAALLLLITWTAVQAQEMPPVDARACCTTVAMYQVEVKAYADVQLLTDSEVVVMEPYAALVKSWTMRLAKDGEDYKVYEDYSMVIQIAASADAQQIPGLTAGLKAVLADATIINLDELEIAVWVPGAERIEVRAWSRTGLSQYFWHPGKELFSEQPFTCGACYLMSEPDWEFYGKAVIETYPAPE